MAAKTAPKPNEKPAAEATADHLVSTAELAEWLGTSDRHVRQLAQDGLIRREGRDRFYLRAAIRAVLERLREQASGRVGDTEGGLDLVQERAALAKSQRIAQDRKNLLAEGELLTAPGMETVVGAMFDAVRAGVLRLPTTATPLLVTARSTVEIHAVLTNLVHDTLTQIAETPIVVQRVRTHDAEEADA